MPRPRIAVAIAALGAALAGPAAASVATPAAWSRDRLPAPARPWPEALARLAAPGVELRFRGEAVLRVWPLSLAAPRGSTEPAAGLAHPDLDDGELVALAELVEPWRDARGQAIAAGRYLLRYARQPTLPDHEGTAPWRDFLLFAPLDPAATPEPLAFAGLLAAARRSSGGPHPAVMALRPATEDDEASLRVDPDGAVVLAVTALGRRRGLVVQPPTPT